MAIQSLQEVVIKFAGDSGDGMQLTGNQFTDNTALAGNDISTFPDFPAEIRAPAGTLAGVSGFQIHFGSRQVNTPGDQFDVLVAMNAAALKSNIHLLKKGGILITNDAGFNSKNLKLAGYDTNPLDTELVEEFKCFHYDITLLTRKCLEGSELDMKSKDRCKNMFVLGLLYWMYDRDIQSSIAFLEERFAQKELILAANIKCLKSGFHFGETTESMTTQYQVDPANLAPGTYRNIIGNKATALGLIAAAQKSGLSLFYGTYPITPASDILHELSKHKAFGVRTFQAEDEIAAACATLGASFGGHLGVTGTSGPGMALKGETIALAAMLELPMVICNIQRAGPSTGMPTKTEQADLMQAMYGRNGECPLPIIAAKGPSDCFETAFEAVRLSVEHMTPVIFLSDGYIANGSEPWDFPSADELPEIKVPYAEVNEKYLAYQRDERLVRRWAVPGTAGLEHRLGGLEKAMESGDVSYDPENHESMVHIRAKKVALMAERIPDQEIDLGDDTGDVLVLGWGSTYGSIRSAVRDCQKMGLNVSHAHLRHIHPFPKNLVALMAQFKQVLVPEINNGQLSKLIASELGVQVHRYNRIQGLPLRTLDISQRIQNLIMLADA